MAKTKLRVTALEDVPEHLREYYTKLPDGSYELDVDGDLTPGQLRQAKAATEAALREKAELEEKLKSYSGIDVKKYEQGLKLLQNVEDETERKLLSEGKYEEVFSARVARMKASHENEINKYRELQAKAESEAKRAQRMMGEYRRNTELHSSLSALGLKPRKGALMDIEARAARVFSVDEETGNLVPRDSNGGIIRGSKGEALSMQEFLSNLATDEAPHVFEAAKGGGGRGDDGRGPGKIVLSKSDPRAMAQHSTALLENPSKYEIVP